jgi:hypothetical protein
MTFPAASFTAVAPPPDGLALAFSSARRRRNSKAVVSAFGGAVAIASVLSFLTPPGQTLVQEPAQPAHGGLLSGLPDAPRHGAPAPMVRTPVVNRPAVIDSLVTSMHPVRASDARPGLSATTVVPDSCSKPHIACADIHTPAPGGPTMQASLCPAAASVTVEYDAPPVGPTRMTASRTVEVGSCDE